MLRKILKTPAGIAGIIVLAFGLFLGFNYDPKPYTRQTTTFITDAETYAKVERENQQKSREQEQELIFIWGSIGFGLLMLGSAGWKVSRPGKEGDAPGLGPNTQITPE
ncbi:MAG: hypothetical protein GXO69_05250 [Acidobacteria bacterium]|nr:hypothetical protein [Acidobacteriota bacterium]